VVSVGGTSLTLTPWGGYAGEAGWGHGLWSWALGGSGGGISSYESKPAYQSGVPQSSTQRTNPDVAYDADPSTGVVVYNNGGYYAVGGTSAGAPQWAGLVAIADQGAALQGLAPLTGATQTLPALYAASQNDFNDVIGGSNGYPAGPGYDLVTGRGTPKAALVVNDLIRVATPAGGAGGDSGLPGDVGSVTTTFSSTPVRSPTSLPPAPLHSMEQTGAVLSPTATQPTGLTVMNPVTTTPAGAAATTSVAPLVILPASPAFTSTAVLPPSASGTAFTAAPAFGAPTVTGLAPPTTFSTSAAGNSGGSGGGTLLGTAMPVLPADGNPAAPAQDNNPAPTPAVPDGAPAAPGAVPGQLDGVPAGDEDAAGGAAFGWEGSESVTLPNSGTAVAALLMALGYRGTGHATQLDEDDRRRYRRSGFPA